MRRTLTRSIAAAALLASLLTVAGAAPASAGKPAVNYGAIAVKPGYHLHLTSITLGGCDALTVKLLAEGSLVAILGDNSGFGCDSGSLSGYDYQNSSVVTKTLVVQLSDVPTGASDPVVYNSDRTGDANHATASRNKISINDASGLNMFETFPPAIGQGNLNLTYDVTRR